MREFKLKNEAGQVVGEAKTTNKDGVVKFESLVPGRYTLEETKAPKGYKALEVTVEVNVVANEVVKQEVMNEKVTGQFEIVKVMRKIKRDCYQVQNSKCIKMVKGSGTENR